MKFQTTLAARTIAAAAALTWVLGTGSAGAALIHAYAMNEGSGTNAADAVGTAHGTLGPAMTDSNWVEGIQGTAVVFNQPAENGPSNNQYVVMNNDPSFDLVDEGTIMMWIRPTTYDPEGRLWQKGSDVGGTCCGYLTVYAAPGGIVNEYPGSGNPNLVGGPAPTNGVWTHVAGSWSTAAGQSRFYINGQPIGWGSFTGALQVVSNGSFMVGHDFGINYPRMFDGAIDEVKVFDNFMTAGEVDAERFNFIETGPAGAPIIEFTAASDTTVFTINTTSGLQYNLEIATNPGTSNFAYSGVTVFGDGGTKTLYDPDGYSTGKLYRVTEWP